MKKEEQEFLEKYFKAGDYSILTLMVTNDEIAKLMDLLKNSGLKLVMMPGVDARVAFADSTQTGTEQ